MLTDKDKKKYQQQQSLSTNLTYNMSVAKNSENNTSTHINLDVFPWQNTVSW